MKKANIIPVLCISLMLPLLSSCISMGDSSSYPKKGDTYAQLYKEDPVVILVMPPINNSNNVDAKDYFYSTLYAPLVEDGYYVLPPFMTLETLQRESAYDAELFIGKDLSKFREVFGADVVMFTTIQSWTKSMLDYTVRIKIDYQFWSTKTNELLYHKTGTAIKDCSVEVTDEDSFLDVLIDIVAGAISTAVTDYVDSARKCTEKTISDLPRGKYHPKHGVDADEWPTSSNIEIDLK